MPANNFNELNNVATYIALMAGVWGAIVSFFKRDINGKSITIKMSLLVMDIFTNVGLTMLSYIGLMGNGVNELLSVAIAGVIGHQGTRGLYLIELIIVEKSGSNAALEEVKGEKRDAKS